MKKKENKPLIQKTIGVPNNNINTSSENINELLLFCINVFYFGRYTDAVRYNDTVLAIDPNNKDALTNKSLALSNLKESTKLLNNLIKILAIYPSNELGLAKKDIYSKYIR